MQDVAQLWGAYGHDESILSNCHIRVAYAPNKIETAEWLSKMTGQTTVVLAQRNHSGARFGAVLTQVSQSYQEVGRALLTPDECMRLKAPQKDTLGAIQSPGDLLVFQAGHAPILGTQLLYFQDPAFSERARIPTPATDRLRSTP